MLRDGIRVIMAWLRRAVTQPFQELNRWQRAARFVYDLGRYGARQLQEDRAPQMAAALAFRTLFGLAPVLVVGTILLKATKGSEAILRSLRELLAAAGLDKIRVVSGSESAGAPGEASVTLAEWLENLTHLRHRDDGTISLNRTYETATRVWHYTRFVVARWESWLDETHRGP